MFYPRIWVIYFSKLLFCLIKFLKGEIVSENKLYRNWKQKFYQILLFIIDKLFYIDYFSKKILIHASNLIYKVTYFDNMINGESKNNLQNE